MEVLVTRCAGLDVHKKTVVACALVGAADAVVEPEVATFGTMTADLERLAGWLAERGVADVVMEATGVYWKPVHNVLERHGGFRLVVGNAEHLKAVPGRKTDVKDAVWLARLLRHGLVRPSFIPDREQRELRELTRYRTALIRERASEVNRLQKTLEAANIKLAAVISDVTGVSGQKILDALVDGEEDPGTLVGLADPEEASGPRTGPGRPALADVDVRGQAPAAAPARARRPDRRVRRGGRGADAPFRRRDRAPG